MSALTYGVYPGMGEWAAQHLNYSQAVRIGDRVHISGQGGWNPTGGDMSMPSSLAEEIEQAFKNVELALQTVGAKGWENVYIVRSYHAKWDGGITGGGADEGATKIMADMFKKYCVSHKPLWTEIGVTRLGLEQMSVEIEVEAYLGN